MTFETIEAQGVEALLERLRDELTGRTYQPLPARKQEIPKDGGKVSIPVIWSRVVQGALKRILELSSRMTSDRDHLDIGPSGQDMTRSSK